MVSESGDWRHTARHWWEIHRADLELSLDDLGTEVVLLDVWLTDMRPSDEPVHLVLTQQHAEDLRKALGLLQWRRGLTSDDTLH